MKAIKKLLAMLFIVSLPLFLITSTVRLAFNSPALYEFGFERQNVSRRTGLSDTQLTDAAKQIRNYFNSDEELLRLRIEFGDETRELFGSRETQHMSDVKDLVGGVYRLQEGTFLYMLLFVTLGFLVQGSQFAGRLRRLLVYGSAGTVAVVGAIGLVSLVAFGPLFRLFHELSFTNDLWMLDPVTSYLVQLFPLGFWLESTLLIGVASIGEAGGIVGLVLLLRWWQGQRRRVAQSKAPQYV